MMTMILMKSRNEDEDDDNDEDGANDYAYEWWANVAATVQPLQDYV